jgi:predicted nucleotidyltransferase
MQNEQASFDVAASARAFVARQARQRSQREARRLAAWQAARQALAAVLPDYPAVRRAYLFGSVTRPGAFRADSDVDIAIEGSSAADYFAIWRRLEEAMPDWLVDVRELLSDTWLAQRIYRQGYLVYERETGHAQG